MWAFVVGVLFLTHLPVHSHSVIHGDLTGVCTISPSYCSDLNIDVSQSNILIGSIGCACVADFGMSTILAEFEGTSYYSSTVGGVIRWRVPELLHISESGDDEPTLTCVADDAPASCLIAVTSVAQFFTQHLHITSHSLLLCRTQHCPCGPHDSIGPLRVLFRQVLMELCLFY